MNKDLRLYTNWPNCISNWKSSMKLSPASKNPCIWIQAVSTFSMSWLTFSIRWTTSMIASQPAKTSKIMTNTRRQHTFSPDKARKSCDRRTKVWAACLNALSVMGLISSKPTSP